MMIRADKFFIEELQARGYDIDFKRLIEAYRASREYPAYKARKKRNAELMNMENFTPSSIGGPNREERRRMKKEKKK